MSEDKRKWNHKQRKIGLGQKEVNVVLDEITRDRLAVLVKAAGVNKGGPSGATGVISEAIRVMHKFEAKKPSGEFKFGWRDQHLEVGKNIIKFLLRQGTVDAAVEKLDKNRFPSASWYGCDSWGDVNLQELVEERKPKPKTKKKNPFIHKIPIRK